MNIASIGSSSTPAKKEALMKEMSRDIENEVKQQTASKHKGGATVIMI